MNLDDVSLVQTVGKAAKSSTESVMSVAFVEKLAMNGSFSHIWSLLSELQILDLFNLYNLKIPATWSSFAENLDEITKLEIVDTEQFIYQTITVPEQEPYSLNFQNAGYDTTIFLLNARSNILLYMIQFSLVILFALFFYCMARCCPN